MDKLRYEHAGTDLAFPLPVAQILYLASSADIHVGTGADNHVGGGDDICNRGLSGVLPCEPYGDGNVVRRAAVRDREKAMEAEQELGAPVVICWR